MITTPRFAFLTALALGATAACGPGSSGTGGDDGGGSGSDQPPAQPLDATGTYTVHSTFDLATNMPGTAGAVVNTIIDATDDADDPSRWIIDQILDQLGLSSFKTADGIIAGAVNDEVLKLAPDFVSTMVQVGKDFGDLAKHVGLKETLTLTPSQATGSYLASHTVVGLHYELGNQQGDLLFSSYQLPNVETDNVAVTMDPTGQLTVAAHDVPLTYGKLLRLGLDAAIIPLIDSKAHNLGDLLVNQVDCAAVGAVIAQAITDKIHITVSADTVASACILGIEAGANFVYSKIDAIDGTALKFSINGSARAVDTNNDRQIDQIQTGTWAGTLAYGATPTPLIPATFFGERQ